VRHPHELLRAIDVVGDAGPLRVGKQEEAAVRERFRRITFLSWAFRSINGNARSGFVHLIWPTLII
jgi:hypothetical protein